MTLRVVDAADAARFGPEWARSYLDDGRAVLWAAGTRGRVACDAERFDRMPRTAVARRLGWPEEPFDFAVRWTRAEVAAKLADMPIVEWLRAPVAPAAWVATVRLAREPVVVSAGWTGPADLDIPGIPIDGRRGPSGKVWVTGGGSSGSSGAVRG